ncbi:MAG: DUF1116 domain-containing protein [Candidatus Ranarchaeia archaeon]
MPSDVKAEIEAANETVSLGIENSDPVFVNVQKAKDVVPELKEKMILHAGPPITWDKMCPTQQGAIVGAIIFEGYETEVKKAYELAGSGEISFSPCNDHAVVAPMAGALSPNMWVNVVENRASRNKAYCNVYEGRGRTTGFGCYGEDVIKKLRWIDTELAPILRDAIKESQGIPLKPIIARAIHMGDEFHSHCVASTLLFKNQMLSLILDQAHEPSQIKKILEHMTETHFHYFLSLAMPAAKACMDSIHKTKNSTIVTTITRNGVQYGIRVAGLGDQWFIGPSSKVTGKFFPGFSTSDASLDMGDSSIVECYGLGGFVLAAAPDAAGVIGGDLQQGIKVSTQMYEITSHENPNYTIPTLGFRGAPTGIDIRKIVRTNITPVINTGVAHREAEKGQIGAGIAVMPLEPFIQALKNFSTQV